MTQCIGLLNTLQQNLHAQRERLYKVYMSGMDLVKGAVFSQFNLTQPCFACWSNQGGGGGEEFWCHSVLFLYLHFNKAEGQYTNNYYQVLLAHKMLMS